MTPRPWHLESDADGGAWFLAADGHAVGYMEHVEDAQLILAALRSFEDRIGGAMPTEETAP